MEDQYRNLLYNVAIIGWLGDIISSITLMCSALTLKYRTYIAEFLLQLWQKGDIGDEYAFDSRSCLTNLVAVGGTVGYVLTLVNLLVSSMLLIGVARRCASLIFPWLLYYALLFGAAVHLALHLVICSLFVDFTIFAVALMIFTMALIIFFKIYHEVYTLFKTMHIAQKTHSALRELERHAAQSGGQQQHGRRRCIFSPSGSGIPIPIPV